MLDFLKQQKHPKDVKAIRSCILEFIKEQLQKTEGGEGSNIKGLQLYVTCPENEKHLYESALYAEEQDRFKEDEVQKIADDFAIALPEIWTMEILFTESAPPETIKADKVDAAIFVSTKKKPAIHKEQTASIKILIGEAEKETYTITSSGGKINIGREGKAQTAEGYYRENFIAFPDKSSNKSNKSISRQHAHIEWNEDAAAFYLFADEGGIPPMNKIKVRTAEGNLIRLLATHAGHHLKEGDQIILGESALLEFKYPETETSST
ncbi:MAG: FHA domain-containing protein [Parafilimonas sp.]